MLTFSHVNLLPLYHSIRQAPDVAQDKSLGMGIPTLGNGCFFSSTTW